MSEEESPVYQRLNFIVETLESGNQAEFARRIGVRSGVVGDMFGKRKNKPSFDVLGKIAAAYPQLRVEWILLGEGDAFKVPESVKTSSVHYDPSKGDLVPRNSIGTVLIMDEPENHISQQLSKEVLAHHTYVKDQLTNKALYRSELSNVQAVGLLSEIPVIELRHVSFKARASFNYAQLQRFKDSDIFDTLLFRLPPGRTAEDYADALVFDIEGDSMEPSLRDGQQVIAWPVSEGKWEHLHNTICVVDYDETVTVKAILKNELFDRDGLTLHATGGAGGSFTVARKDIHSIWEVREFYGIVPVRLLA